MNTVDGDFVFNEITANFQAVTVQGLVTFRIVNPKRVATLLNYAIHPGSRSYKSQDPAKLTGRIVNIIQEGVRLEVQRLSLEDTLRQGAALARAVQTWAAKHPDAVDLGIEILNVFLTSLRPTPEVAKALEADYRELLMKKADQAIYDRRVSAVEQERRIRENELGTDIALEQERTQLGTLQAENRKQEAESEARALEAKLQPWRAMDHRTILAMGMKALGENAAKIGNLTITPDLLSALLKDAAK